MDWLEQNLDAYRIIAEILNDLRETLRKRLEALHGSEWYRSGLPEGMLSQLVERKEQEKAIDWYESEYQQIMNYALFPDLLAILEHNAQALPQILKLAPTSSLLQARFLELEVMRGKLGRARPISETELSFLGTFHLRFRRAIEEHRQHTAADAQQPRQAAPPAGVADPGDHSQTPPPPTDAAQRATGPNAHTDSTPASSDQGTASAAPPEQQPVTPPPPLPEQQPVTPPTAPPEQQPVTPPTRPPEQQPVTPPPPLPHEQPAVGAEQPAASPPPSDATQPETVEVESPEEEMSLEDALEGDHRQAILRELYREVTTIAEGIWVKDIPPPARAWEKVSVSPWYEENFSPLGLRPLSDFYDIIAKVDQQMRAGSSRDELQRFLKEVNFAQILLSLRDMFQRNQI